MISHNVKWFPDLLKIRRRKRCKESAKRIFRCQYFCLVHLGVSKWSHGKSGNLSPVMASNFWVHVKTYLTFEQRRGSCGVPLSLRGACHGRRRGTRLQHTGAPFIFLSDMLSLMLQRGAVLIVWTDHSRESGFDLGCWQNRHRLAALLWCLSCQFWHCIDRDKPCTSGLT